MGEYVDSFIDGEGMSPEMWQFSGHLRGIDNVELAVSVLNEGFELLVKLDNDEKYLETVFLGLISLIVRRGVKPHVLSLYYSFRYYLYINQIFDNRRASWFTIQNLFLREYLEGEFNAV